MNGVQNRIDALLGAINSHPFRPRYILMQPEFLQELEAAQRVRTFDEHPEFGLFIMDEENKLGAILVLTQQPHLSVQAFDSLEKKWFFAPGEKC